MKIAIVSTDGINVNDHFGKAKKFLIYEMKDAGLTFIEARENIPLSVDDPNHAFDAERFDKISDVIRDCKRVYMTQIGEVPSAELKKRGIEPHLFSGPIGKIS